MVDCQDNIFPTDATNNEQSEIWFCYFFHNYFKLWEPVIKINVMNKHYCMLINIIVFQFQDKNYGMLTSREMNFSIMIHGI